MHEIGDRKTLATRHEQVHVVRHQDEGVEFAAPLRQPQLEVFQEEAPTPFVEEDVGPVVAAGPLVAALTGAGLGPAAGAITGGLTASMIDFGLDREYASYYAEGVRRGGAMVAVRADEGRASQVESILNRHGMVDIDRRVESWRNSGWTGFDESSPAYTRDEIDAERRRYLNN